MGETRRQDRGETRGKTRGEQGPLSYSLTSCPSCWWGPYIVAFWWGYCNLDGGKTGGNILGQDKGAKQGAKWGKTGQSEIILGFRVPTTCGKKKFD